MPISFSSARPHRLGLILPWSKACLSLTLLFLSLLSALSAQAQAPIAPILKSVISNAQTVTLTVQTTTSLTTTYLIWRSTTPGGEGNAYAYATQTLSGTLPPTGSTIQLTDPTAVKGQTYYYRVPIRANSTFSAPQSNELSVVSQIAVPITVTALAINPNSVVGGSSTTGTVTISSPAPTNGVTVFLSNDAQSLGIPSPVLVPAGATSTMFPITTTAVTAPTVINVTPIYNGYGKSVALTINPAPTVPAYLSSLVLIPASVTGSSGTTGTITLSAPAPANGLTISLASDNAAASVSPSVPIAAGATGTTFPITTTAVTASTAANIMATYNGVSKGAALKIYPPANGASGGFNLASNPVNIIIVQGSSMATGVSVTPINGFTGQVVLSVLNPPLGVTASTTPATVSGTTAQTSTLTLNLQNSARPGRYSLDIKGSATATDGTPITSSTLIILTVAPTPTSVPFSVTANNDLVNLAPGASDTSTISISSASGFSQNVSLAISDDLAYPIVTSQSDPSKVALAFGTQAIAPGNNGILSVAAGASVPAGVYHLLITATASNGQQAVTPFTIVISEDSVSETALALPAPANPNAPDQPASSISDMERIEADGSPQAVGTITSSVSNSVPNSQSVTPNVVGADDRQPVPTYFPYPFSAVCRITVVMSDGKVFYGTGTLVGKNHVLTAAHVLYDKFEGGYAKVVKVYPGYNGRPNPNFGYAFAKQKGLYVSRDYRLNSGLGTTFLSPGDDFALIDLMPISNALPSVNGKSLGDVAGYVQMADDFEDATGDIYTTIAGYPGPVNGHDLQAKYMYQDFYGNGSGDKSVYPVANILASPLDDTLFTAIDADEGESGAGFLHTVDLFDTKWTVYGVFDDVYRGYGSTGIIQKYQLPQYGEAIGARITTKRLQILKNVMALDGDDIAY